ncbi:MAG: hypothetical protein WC877_01995 [Dehalococcoidales bacterium]|jgi:hypothetical protein
MTDFGWGYPPGVTSVPGDFDKDASYNAYITLTYTHYFDKNLDLNCKELVDIAIKQVNQNHIGIIPNYNTVKIIDFSVHEYITFSFEADIEGDTTIDCQYFDYEDDTELINDIVDDINEKLDGYDFDIIEVHKNEISYVIH